MESNTIGIVGAGKLGITLAQLARKAGYEVYISGSREPSKIELSVQVLAPGAYAVTTSEVVRVSDIVILAIPLSKFRLLKPEDFTDKLVVDAMNYWWEVDGPRTDSVTEGMSSSEAVQLHLSQARIVKALNHMGYHDLHDETRPTGTTERKAIAVAGDDPADIDTVSRLIDTLGFDALNIGVLSNGTRLEPGHPAFGANVTTLELARLTS